MIYRRKAIRGLLIAGVVLRTHDPANHCLWARLNLEHVLSDLGTIMPLTQEKRPSLMVGDHADVIALTTASFARATAARFRSGRRFQD